MRDKKEKKGVHKKSPATNEGKNDVAAVPIAPVPAIAPKSSSRMNFHEKVSFSRKNDEPEAPIVEQQEEKKKRSACVITANANNDGGLNAISSSSSAGPHFGPAAAAGTRVPRAKSTSNQSDEMWNAKCAALAEYCRVNQKLPAQKNTIVEVEGLGTVDLGIWCDNQKHRYKGSRGCSAFTPAQEKAFKAIKEVSEWCQQYSKYAADPLFSNATQRWDSNYAALVEYCELHKKLPSLAQNFDYQGHELKLGRWTDNQKKRWKTIEGRALSEDERRKLEAVAEFVVWTLKPDKKNKPAAAPSNSPLKHPIMIASDFEITGKKRGKGSIPALLREAVAASASSSSSSSAASGGREKKRSRKGEAASLA